MPEGACSRQIDGQSDQEHQDRREAGLDVQVAKEQPGKRFINDVESRQREQSGLDECGEVLKFPVPVGMPLIGRLVGHAHGEKSNDRGNQVQAGVQRLRKDAQASRADDEKCLQRNQQHRGAALLSVGSAVLLVSLKTFLVVRTGSLGVLSEALHSGLDLIAAIITFLSVRMSDQPADERHPYGHGKFENFSAFIETGLLALTALYIVYEAFDRLFFRSVHIQPSVTAILVLLVALSVDLTRARALRHVARKYSSEALEADALHFSTDVWSTIGEIVPSDVMVHAEPRAPQGEHLFEAIRAAAQSLGLAIHDLTAVQQDGRLFIELHLEVDEQLSLREAHRQATELEEKIRELRDGQVEVNIHIEPLGRHIATPDAGAGQMKPLSRAIEDFLNKLPLEFDELVNCNDVRARQVEHHILVSCHCTMKSELPITQIHDVTAALEDRVKEKFPQIYRVTIHPEPFEEK